MVTAGKSILPRPTVNYLFAEKHKIKKQFPDCLEMFFSHEHILRERKWAKSNTATLMWQRAPHPQEKA